MPLPSLLPRSLSTNPMPGRSALLALAGACAWMAVPVAAHAQVSPALDRVSVSVGGFHSEPTIAARANTSLGTINTREFGTESTTMPRLRAEVLLFDNHGLSFDYYRYRRSFSQTGTGTVNIVGNQVTATTDIGIQAKLEFSKLAYKWWFGSGNTALGLGLGAGYYRADASGFATATVAGNTRRVDASVREDAVAPLIELGLRHAITPDLRLIADVSGVEKRGGSTRGSIYNAALGIEWFPVKNVGLVASYETSDITLKRRDEIDDRLRVRIHGPSAYLKVRF